MGFASWLRHRFSNHVRRTTRHPAAPRCRPLCETLEDRLCPTNVTFGPTVNWNAGNFPNSVVVADFNGDGRADLAAANAGSNNVSVLLGNGSGGFAAPANFAAGS